jgi:hypothetical protein
VLERFIASCPIKTLGLFGGDLNNVDLTIEPPAETLRGLKLKDMPNVNLEPFLEKLNQYNLEDLALIRLEQITKEWFDQYFKPCLLNSEHLYKLRFEINHENFTHCFPSLVEVIAKHSAFLRHLSFAKTPVSTQNIRDMVAALQTATGGQRSALEVVDLSHIFANEGFSFQEAIAELSKLSSPDKFLNVYVSRYQVKTAKDIQDFVNEASHPITVIFDARETLKKGL